MPKQEVNGQKSVKKFQADLKIRLKIDFIHTCKKTMISNIVPYNKIRNP